MSSIPLADKPPEGRRASVVSPLGRIGGMKDHWLPDATRIHPLSSQRMALLWAGALCVLAWVGLATLSADYASMMVSGGLLIIIVSIILVEAVGDVQRQSPDNMGKGQRVPIVIPQAVPSPWASTTSIPPRRPRVG